MTPQKRPAFRTPDHNKVKEALKKRTCKNTIQLNWEKTGNNDIVVLEISHFFADFDRAFSVKSSTARPSLSILKLSSCLVLSLIK